MACCSAEKTIPAEACEIYAGVPGLHRCRGFGQRGSLPIAAYLRVGARVCESARGSVAEGTAGGSATMMQPVGEIQVYLHRAPIDMRLGRNGLAASAQEVIEADLFE